MVSPACSTSGEGTVQHLEESGPGFLELPGYPHGDCQISGDRGLWEHSLFFRASIDIFSFLLPRDGRNVQDPANTDEDFVVLGA